MKAEEGRPFSTTTLDDLVMEKRKTRTKSPQRKMSENKIPIQSQGRNVHTAVSMRTAGIFVCLENYTYFCYKLIQTTSLGIEFRDWEGFKMWI